MDWTFSAIVERITDADTYDLEIDVGFQIKVIRTVRLLSASNGGVNAPEPKGATKAQGVAATARVRELCPVGTAVHVRTVQYKQDGFRRYLAQVTLPDGRDLGDLLLLERHVVVWRG